jgi:hypothetical protein
MIDDDATFQIDRTRIQSERFEDETVLINVESGFYYSLSSSGTELLQLVDAGCPAGMLTVALLGDSPEARGQQPSVLAFLAELVREGILIGRRRRDLSDPPPDLSRPVYPSAEGFERPVLERFDEVRDLLLIDPVHMVDETQGWPKTR